MKIPILQGSYADAAGSFRTSYPINLEPNLVDSGIAKGYLTSAPGIRQISTGQGRDRGAINWNGNCYRAMGSNLLSVSATGIATSLGLIGTNNLPTTMDYSFDRLAIASNQGLFYWTPSEGVTQVTDPNLGVCLDVMWIDGYFMTTDGENLIVTELNNPYAVNPLFYGSSEADPDPVMGLGKVRGEAYALNRYTIQNFQDVGGSGFPFTNNPGGLIPTGVVGTHAWAYFLETFAFVGSARNEQLSVYLAGSGQSINISTSEIDHELAKLSVADQAMIECETRVEEGEQRFYVHLPTKTMVYMRQASLQSENPVWHYLCDGLLPDMGYAARHMVQCFGEWMVGDNEGNIGLLDTDIETRFSNPAAWQFDTVLLYNDAKGGTIKSLELVGLPGRAPFGVDATCSLQISQDATKWGQPRFISMGNFGQMRKRVQWRPKTRFRNYAGLRFRGASTAIASWATLEADIEPLAV